ncbi:MAG: hypothetical protein NWQ54_09375 [Paraglaciecola sp.]|nr:hypothetical protein [Paraglaciecola sp.]
MDIEQVRKDAFSGEFELISFDIFDTLVLRNCQKPADIFNIAFAKSQPLLNFNLTAAEYCELRIEAERKARQEIQTEEINWDDIFGFLPFSAAECQILKQAELVAEKENSFLNQDWLELIFELCNRKIAVCLISDMYFSVDQIQKSFFSTSSLLSSLPLYVSCEFKSTKATGQLFEDIRTCLKINYQHWLHIGDNLHADVNIPSTLGIKGVHYGTLLPVGRIKDLEHSIASLQSNQVEAIRLIAGSFSSGPMQQLGAFVFGPIMLSFVDWVIDLCLQNKVTNIVCVMREGNTFAPLIKHRVSQRKINDINIVKLFVSRKSTFLPSLDTSQNIFIDVIIDSAMQRKGYTVADLYSELGLEWNDSLHTFADVLMQDINLHSVDGEPLIKRLKAIFLLNKPTVVRHIEKQKNLLKAHFTQQSNEVFSQSAIIDLGNGGTIQHQLEQVFLEKSKLNLLFYSSKRILRYSDCTRFHAFLGPHSDKYQLREKLTRSPECIEPLLVGITGSVLAYDSLDKEVIAIESRPTIENKAPWLAFVSGIHRFFDDALKYGLPTVEVKDAITLLARYVLMPSLQEARLFEQIYHEDNFGSEAVYPVIDAEQKKIALNAGIANFVYQYANDKQAFAGVVHWPMGLISLLNPDYFYRLHCQQSEAMEFDTSYIVEVLNSPSPVVTIYGAGQCCESLFPQLSEWNIKVDRIVDRKAEYSPKQRKFGCDIVTLNVALGLGSRHFLIASKAFKQQIKLNILSQAKIMGLENEVIIL